jgi:hypothetical protein
MSGFTRPFRYHAVDANNGQVLGTYGSQQEATTRILHEGESIAIGPGETRDYVVRIETIATGETYDVPLQVEAPAPVDGHEADP